MITFANGPSFEFMTASGALAFDGRGWPWEWPLRWIGLLDPQRFVIVTKTLTRYPRVGHLRWSHPWSVVKILKKDSTIGILNAIGLTNKGIDWWLEKVSPRIPTHYRIVVSIEAEDKDEVVEMLRMLEGQKIVGVELNFSCPNTTTFDTGSSEKIMHICASASQVSPFPLIAKISYTHDYQTLAKAMESFSLSALSINSVPWSAVYPGLDSPLAPLGGGGISGQLVQSQTWKMVEEMAAVSTIPVIGPSVWNYEDISEIFRRGAKAVSFGSLFVRYPWRPTLFVKRWEKEKLGVK